MDVRTAGGGQALSKVEAIKEASRYLYSTSPTRSRNGADALHRGRRDDPQVPRLVPAGRPRRPDAAEARGEGEGLRVHGPRPHARRQITAAQYLAHRPAGPDRRQRHAPDHDAAGVPAPRRRSRSTSPTTIRAINEVLLSTLAACGDVERNVLGCPAPIRDGVRDAMQADADRFAVALLAAVVELLRHLARRREGRQPAPAAGRARRGHARPERRRGRADLRQDLPPAQVQDGVRPARGQLHRHPRQRPRLPGDRRGREARRLQRPRRRRAGHDAERRQDLPVPGASRWRSSAARRSSKSARGCSRSTATSATAPTASGPGSSTSSTTGASRRSGPRSRSTSAIRSTTRSRSR